MNADVYFKYFRRIVVITTKIQHTLTSLSKQAWFQQLVLAAEKKYTQVLIDTQDHRREYKFNKALPTYSPNTRQCHIFTLKLWSMYLREINYQKPASRSTLPMSNAWFSKLSRLNVALLGRNTPPSAIKRWSALCRCQARVNGEASQKTQHNIPLKSFYLLLFSFSYFYLKLFILIMFELLCSRATEKRCFLLIMLLIAIKKAQMINFWQEINSVISYYIVLED